MHFILASSSRYRAELIRQIGICPQVIPPDIDETPLPNEMPDELAVRLAEEKCLAVISQLTLREMPALVIASDQVASCEQRVLGKPIQPDAAIEQLLYLSGKEAVFYTSLYLYSTKDQNAYSYLDQTRVKFRSLSRKEIEHYIELEKPLDCAGSFKCESLGICLFDSIESKDPSALIGLPLIALNKGLLSFGVNPLLTLRSEQE